ncbi:MAG: histidine phosphatase family protein [Actinomycetota bacterium]
MTQRLYLIRHGQADYTSDARLTTSRGVAFDPPLSATGSEQALALAARLRHLPAPTAVYSSTLARARQTARAYSEPTGVDVTEVEDLGEWYGGGWEFKDFSQIFDEHPDARHLFRTQQPAWHLAPEAESGAEFATRVRAAIEVILAEHRQGDLYLFVHGGVINAFLAPILGIQGQEMFFLPANTSINTVLIDGAERRAWFLSDDAHLTNPEWFDR